MKSIFLFIILLIGSTVFAQQQKSDIDFERLVDEILAVQDEDINYEDLYENLLQLYSNPIDLNTISEAQLRSLYILNETQVQSFLAYREEADRFLSLYELQSIEGIDETTIEKLIPFVTIKDETTSINKHLFKRILSESNNYLLTRYERTIENKADYTTNASVQNRYTGSPDRLYTRFLSRRTNDFSLGFTGEKDAGEKIYWNSKQKQFGADFISFHIQAQNKGKIKNLIVGDYQAQFGQGLMLGSAFGIGKNAEAVTTMRKSNLGFLPYTSVNESNYFRGVAITYAFTNKWSVSGMLSRQWRDGNLQSEGTESGQNIISSIQLSGLHRTPNELADRKALLERNVAAGINYHHKSLDLGALAHFTDYNKEISRNLNRYNQFYFNGNNNTNLGLYLNYTWNQVAFFSEVSQTMHHGMALVTGLLSSVTRSLDVSMVYRRFDRTYYSFYNNAVTENALAQNEKGMYWGWKYTFSKKISFSGYYDWFLFPWLRYRSYAPSEGHEWLLRLSIRPTKRVALFLQAREENKDRNVSDDSNLYLTSRGIKRNYWANIDYEITPGLTFKTRIQMNTFSFEGRTTNGLLLLQDINWRHGKLSLSARYALFETDDYDNRIYVYEKDVWLAFSFPAYYGSGIRNYVLAQYSVSKNIELWARWSRTRYSNIDELGSGSELIEGNTRNDIKFQLMFKF